MKETQLLDISFSDKLKLWLFALWYAITVCLKNFVVSFWRSQAGFIPVDKPITHPLDQSARHMFIKVNGVKFHYVECGSKELPLLLLIHGFPDCWLGWRHQVNVLSKSYRVVAVDLKGFGDSEKPQWRGSYRVRRLISELLELIHALGADSCTIVGHDLGALLGWFLVAEYPSAVTKFIAISSPHPNIIWNYLSGSDGVNSRFVCLSQIPVLPEAEIRKENLAFIDRFYKHLQKTKETELLKTYKYVFSRTKDVSGPVNYYRNLPFMRLKPKKLMIPTLLILGSEDPYVSVEALVRSTQFLEDFKIKMIDGVGHFPHQENSSEVNGEILEFLIDPLDAISDGKVENQRGLIGSLVTNTFKYGNSLVDNMKKSTNNVVWRPQLLKSTG